MMEWNNGYTGLESHLITLYLRADFGSEEGALFSRACMHADDELNNGFYLNGCRTTTDDTNRFLPFVDRNGRTVLIVSRPA